MVGKEWAVWEPTVWECPDGMVRMLARNNNWGPLNKGGDPTTRMLLSSMSRDRGATWSAHEYVPIETIASRMHVLPIGGGGFAMVHNDWPKGRFVSDRQNMALFFNRGGGWGDNGSARRGEARCRMNSQVDGVTGTHVADGHLCRGSRVWADKNCGRPRRRRGRCNTCSTRLHVVVHHADSLKAVSGW